MEYSCFVPSDISYLKKTSNNIIDFLSNKIKISSDDVFYLRLVIEEAVRNAMQHGNQLNPSLLVDIKCSLKGSKITLIVEDKGKGFDHKKVPNPTKGLNVYKEGGRGVFLIKSLMDEVYFNDSGNKITMIKYINQNQNN